MSKRRHGLIEEIRGKHQNAQSRRIIIDKKQSLVLRRKKKEKEIGSTVQLANIARRTQKIKYSLTAATAPQKTT